MKKTILRAAVVSAAATPLIVLSAGTASAGPVITIDTGANVGVELSASVTGETFSCFVVGPTGAAFGTASFGSKMVAGGFFFAPGPVTGFCFGAGGFVTVGGSAG